MLIKIVILYFKIYLVPYFKIYLDTLLILYSII